MARTLHNRLTNLPQAAAIDVVNADGQVVVSSRWVPQQPIDVSRPRIFPLVPRT